MSDNSELTSYIVFRPYGLPKRVNILANSGKEALNLANKEYGFTTGAKAFKVFSNSPIILDKIELSYESEAEQ